MTVSGKHSPLSPQSCFTFLFPLSSEQVKHAQKYHGYTTCGENRTEVIIWNKTHQKQHLKITAGNSNTCKAALFRLENQSFSDSFKACDIAHWRTLVWNGRNGHTTNCADCFGAFLLMQIHVGFIKTPVNKANCLRNCPLCLADIYSPQSTQSWLFASKLQEVANFRSCPFRPEVALFDGNSSFIQTLGKHVCCSALRQIFSCSKDSGLSRR